MVKRVERPKEPNLSARKQLWGLVQLVPDTEDGYNLCYIVGESASDVWNKVIATEWFGTGQTIESIRKRGWRARKITVVIAE